MYDMKNKLKLIKKAQKHINLNLSIKQIFEQRCPEYNVYLATHTRSPIYLEFEEKSKEEFWSLKLRTPKNHRPIKDPDIIITDNDNAIFLIEVKWGGIDGYSTTDLKIDEKTLKKMLSGYQFGGDCSMRGPATRNGKRYKNEEFLIKKNATVDDKTQFILVSDFQSLKGLFGLKQYKEIVDELKQQLQNSYVIADIHEQVDDIPCLENII